MVFAGFFSALVKKIVDAGTTTIPVTAAGDAQVDTSTKKFGTGSCLLDGTDDYLEIDTAYNSTFSFTGDFTVELWAYKKDTNSPQLLLTNWTYGFWFGYFTTNEFRVYVNDTGNFLSATYTPSTNTWVHYAVVRSGTTVTLYINGTSYGTSTESGTVNMTQKTTFGANGNNGTPTQFWYGNLEEIRISDTARYTANFTPATSAFTYDSNTVLLLHCDGTNGSTSFPDDIDPRTQIPVVAEGDAQVDTSEYKFGTGSCELDGASDYLRIDSTYNGYFDLSDDFTVELWARKDTHNNTGNGASSADQQRQILVSNWGDSSNAFYLAFFTSNTMRVYVNTVFGSSVNYVEVNYTASLNTWTHYAVVRSGSSTNNITLYVDGIAKGSFTYNGAINLQDEDWAFGANSVPDTPKQFFKGRLDEIRISKTARYTSNFTPSAAKFLNDADTLLLLHCDGSDQSTTFTDDNLITTHSNVTFTSSNASASSVGSSYTADKAFNSNDVQGDSWISLWSSAPNAYNQTSPFAYTGSNSTTVDGTAIAGEWLQMDFGSGNTKYISKHTIATFYDWDDVNTAYMAEFMIAGSTNNTTWTEIGTYDQGQINKSSTLAADGHDAYSVEFDSTNIVPSRYIRLIGIRVNKNMAIREWQMKELV